MLYGLFNVFSLRVKEIVLVFPYQDLWIVYPKDLKIFIPTPKEAYRVKNLSKHIVLKKYTFEPYVILGYGDVIVSLKRRLIAIV